MTSDSIEQTVARFSRSYEAMKLFYFLLSSLVLISGLDTSTLAQKTAALVRHSGLRKSEQGRLLSLLVIRGMSHEEVMAIFGSDSQVDSLGTGPFIVSSRFSEFGVTVWSRGFHCVTSVDYKPPQPKRWIRFDDRDK